MENKETQLLEKIILFLVIFVGGILIFNAFQYSNLLEEGLLTYLSLLLVLSLVGSVIWLFISRSSEGHKELKHSKIEEQRPLTTMDKATFAIVALVALLVIFNQMQLSQASSLAGINSGFVWKSASSKTTLKLTGDPTQDAIAIVIPTGTPFYGQELGVSFDDPIKSLEIIAQLDPAYGRNKVQLTGAENDRYIKILTTPTITCEYCCGVKTAVTKDGSPTCGCKHAWAIRGLAAYIIKYYPDVSDDEIYRELAKWKSLFFPKQMIQKYLQETQTGEYTPDIAALLLDIDEEKLAKIKTSVASNPNSDAASTVSSIDDLPNMVGGC